MKERLAVALSFALIFAFSAVDNAVSPMVAQIAASYSVNMEAVLWFISACTSGTVLGVFLGPWLVARLGPLRLLTAATVLLAAAQAVFLLGSAQAAGLAARFAAGFCTGSIASVMWWLTFHGVSKKYYPAMIAVLMSARPLATAIGVPLAGLLAWESSWQLPYWLMAGLMAASGLGLAKVFPAGDGQAPAAGLLEGYRRALSVPYAAQYYAGFTINRMCYFGFYAVAGIWFIEHYGLNLKAMSLALLVIGLAEALINFVVPRIIKRFGHWPTLNASLAGSLVSLLLFIWGGLELRAAVAAITVFMLLDRVYSMALVITIPEMFPATGDKTAFGSLNTLTAWGGLSLVSALAGRLIPLAGLRSVEVLLVAAFTIGTGLLYYVQARTVPKNKPA